MVYSLSTNLSAINQNDKIEVPVPSNISVYAQFKYVRGIPAQGSQDPLPISRVKVIDNMVSYLNSPPRDANLNRNEEYTLQELETEIHKVVNEDSQVFNSNFGKSADSGIIFNITA